MPFSRELQNKKSSTKDRQPRSLLRSGHDPKKGGAGAHNWGTMNSSTPEDGVTVLDHGDPNYDSEDEKDKEN